MNQFNDDQYDRVCDENEEMQKDINRLEAIVEDRNQAIAVFQDVVERNNVDLGILRAELAAAKAEVDNLRSMLINLYPDLNKELKDANKAIEVIRSDYDMVYDECKEAYLRVEKLESALRIETEHARIQRELAEDERGKCVQLEAQLREAKIVDYSKLAKLVAFHVLTGPLKEILEKEPSST